MEWVSLLIPILFICLFIYGLVKQVQNSILLLKTVSPTNPYSKRLLLGNHLLSFSFGGFVFLLILNVFVYTGVLPQSQQFGNTVSLFSFLFLLLMFISKFGIIPKAQIHFLQPISRRI